ncbi:ricin B-like lectin R40C1 [Phragmites australis]|uniref:ricin B-like lectin R40C1 n=1 Tax=Phragmites australis TaxID=29695 RepID=UPI002D7A2428|nr:ricin B-like lectin R40C1 [Phragmites australis]
MEPMRIFCKGNTTLNMAVRGDKVILVRADSNDKSQHWFQDHDAVGKLTDDQGRRAFALVNRTTGQAMVNRNNVVRLAPYSGDVAVELSMLWSLGVQLPGGFAEIRTLKDISQTLNGINGYVKEGTVVGMYNSEPHSVNAIWKIYPIINE